jgi:outer membrane receptor protein involved in Fe transport
MRKTYLLAATAILAMGSVHAWAADTDAGDEEKITVTADPVLTNAALNPNLVPAQTTSISAADIAVHGQKSLTGALANEMAGVSLGDTAGNPNQPSLTYHGYSASPVQGVTQGLAIYQDGVRLNEAFGDTMDWDLLPPGAIARVDLEGANPVFGLNALGGAISIRAKTGFDANPNELAITGGSFGTLDAQGEYSKIFGANAIFLAGRIQHQDGWRVGQSSDIHSFYGDFGHRMDEGEWHIRLGGAINTLDGPGTSPIQLVAVDRAAAYTSPNGSTNKALNAAFSYSKPLSDGLTLQTTAYWRYFFNHIVNGNAPNDMPCLNSGDLGYLCTDAGTSDEAASTDRLGNAIPVFSRTGYYSELDLTTTNSNSYGGSAQLSGKTTMLSIPDNFVTGASFDGSTTIFSATPIIGGLDPVTRDWFGPGITLDEPGQTAPTRVAINSQTFGIYVTNSWRLTERFDVTLAARANDAAISLTDQDGGGVNGNHNYFSLNPALGVTYTLPYSIHFYGGYAQTNRAPTPAELSCASPLAPCTLANFFTADPNLHQVEAQTFEAGLRGKWHFSDDIAVHGDASLFRTDADNDIVYVNSDTQGRAYFQNIHGTRREGVAMRVTASHGPVHADISWALTEAFTRSAYTEAAGNNPDGNANGQLAVPSGARLPGIPRNRIDANLDWDMTDKITIGGDIDHQSSRVFFGDEANVTPPLPGFTALNATSSWQIRDNLSLVGRVENLTGQHYATYGTFAPIGSVPLLQVPNASNPRAINPAAPRAIYVTLKANF